MSKNRVSREKKKHIISIIVFFSMNTTEKRDKILNFQLVKYLLIAVVA